MRAYDVERRVARGKEEFIRQRERQRERRREAGRQGGERETLAAKKK